MRARSLLFDLWGDYIQHVGGEVYTSTLTRYLAPFGISEAALRQALSRASREGWLQSRRVAGRSAYSLSPRGRRRIVEASKRVYDPDDLPWDGYWRMLAYSIPETKRSLRDDLRRELAWTGFAPLSQGTWLSPNPLEAAAEELVQRYGLQEYVTLFRATHTGPGTPVDLVARCWDLTGLQQSYDRFIAQWEPQLSKQVESEEAAFVERITLVHDYRKFLFVDPGLPRELLPQGWRGTVARELFQTYYSHLDPAARRFMDAAFEAPRTHSQEVVAHV